MEGDGEYPIGFRFQPKEDELVDYYLLPRLQGRPTVPNDSVVEANVYACHPETLINEHRGAGRQDEWYFLSPRARMYSNGVRPARKTLDGRGRWKASTATKEVAQVVVRNGIKFCKSVLNYFEGTPKEEARTKWIMLEITVPEYEIKLDRPGARNLLDEYVMCKIYVSPQHKKKCDDDDEEEEEGTGSVCEEDEEACSSTQHGQVTAEPNLSEKQAGKRPMVEQPPQRGRAAPARKQARGGSLGIGSTQSSCSTSNAAAPTELYYGGGPGAHYGLQLQAPATMQRSAGAYSGQAPATPPAGACGGRGLGQMPTLRPVIYQPFSDQTGDPFGQMATMTRPPNPAARRQCFPGSPPPRHPGTAFTPQVSLQCFYDQNYRAVPQPPGYASSSQLQRQAAFPPPQQMQQPFFHGNASRRVGDAAVPRGPPYNGHPYLQRSSLTAAVDGRGGAANAGSGAARLNVNAEQYFVDLATINPSLAGGCMQLTPAPAPLVESPAPAAAGAAEVQTETGATSGLTTQDAA
ncbi:hypothetical protein GQ55_2G278000 [Panicum hallii var. hallii]|uniref:NAC domain-containing protein n=1 Tax=Panicum hallii var. hallii TaxID=1504633 RepID=A0A2T7ET24_9POAL|nr:hypothetical protein GQ55_2G278000 [Panicum hallii var. hallii]